MKKIFENLPENERRNKLKAHAWRIEQREFVRPATEEFLDKLVDEALSLTAENDAMMQDESISTFERAKKLEKTSQRIAEISGVIKSKTIAQYEDVFLMPNYETRQMHIYDGEGCEIEVRALRAYERQSNIFNSSLRNEFH
jgi:hypothetical protein